MYKAEGFNQLLKILNANVDELYRQSFKEYDLPVLYKPEERYYIWTVKNSGTYLIPKSQVGSDDYIKYLFNDKNVNFYEIDTDTFVPTHIDNIEQYVDMCFQSDIFQEQYAFMAYDDFDYDY